jgi:hypothetical protein
MNRYVKPTIKLIELRTDERLACCTGYYNDRDDDQRRGKRKKGGSWGGFWGGFWNGSGGSDHDCGTPPVVSDPNES